MYKEFIEKEKNFSAGIVAALALDKFNSKFEKE